MQEEKCKKIKFFPEPKIDEPVKSPFYPILVIPAKAGIHLIPAILDSCLRRSDGFSTF